MSSIDRRGLIRSAAAIGFGRWTCGCCVAAEPAGCVIEDPHRLANDRMSAFAFAQDNVVRKSGVANLDDDIVFALKAIRSSFSVAPAFAYYDDGQIGNSGASKASLFAGSKGTVLFGLKLLKELLARPDGDAAVVAVCAHEFGHVVGFDTGLYDQLVTDPARPLRGEQHADYLAGFFAGQRKLLRPDYPALAILQTLRSLAGGTHGSEQQRADAVWEGFKAAHDRKMPILDGVQAGFEWSMKRPEA